MFKFRSLVVAATAATVAIGGLTLATTTPADATGWKRHHGYHDRGVVVDRGPVVRGWFGRRDRDGWFARKWHRKKASKHHRRGVAGWFGRRDRVVVERRPVVRGWVGRRDRDGWFHRKWHKKKAWKHRRHTVVETAPPRRYYRPMK